MSLKNMMSNKSILFIGYSPSDRDLNLIANSLWGEQGLCADSWFIHQSEVGELERCIWEKKEETEWC